MGLKRWFRRRAPHDFREELEIHIALRAEHDGSDTDAARRRLGNMLQTQEEMRRVWISPLWDVLVQDARFAWRSWRRSPGHCDERCSAEYNIGLGDHRARRAAEILFQFGLTPDRVQIVSYGKEAPQCRVSDEACWQRNRRAHLVVRTSAPTE